MLKRALPWILLLSGWVALAAYICALFFCAPKVAAAASAESSAPLAAVAPIAKAGVWNYTDGSAYSMAHAKYFEFKESSYAYIEPLDSKFSSSIEETAQYLVGHPNRQLNITGYYRGSEENTSILPNMGLARANDVKSYLQTFGVSSSQLTTSGVEIEDKWFKNGILTKGIDFTFSEKNTSNSRIPDIKSRLVGKPLTLYFQTNQNTLTLSASQRKDFADMFYYLDNVEGSSLGVSGHTDNVGSRNYNVKLSKDRANFVKNYLVEKGGLDDAKLNPVGLGPDKPITSNDTAEGRSKNRRVEVTLQ